MFYKGPDNSLVLGGEDEEGALLGHRLRLLLAADGGAAGAEVGVLLVVLILRGDRVALASVDLPDCLKETGHISYWLVVLRHAAHAVKLVKERY